MDDLLTSWLARLGRWVRMHPTAGSRSHTQIAEEIGGALAACGLTVARYAHASGDILVARRASCGPLLGMYGHYDVESGGRTAMLVADGRVYGRGVGDNLGPLSLRLSVLERYPRCPNLLWVIEPGEEAGSPALAEWLKETTAPQPDLWLDETGYFDAGGAQRVLAVDPDERAREVMRRCADLAAAMGRATYVEQRRLRRVVPGAGFGVEALFQGAPYLALGPNDDCADVHGDQESLPLDTIALSMRQFEALLESFAPEAAR